jgi:hypothetical protein
MGVLVIGAYGLAILFMHGGQDQQPPLNGTSPSISITRLTEILRYHILKGPILGLVGQATRDKRPFPSHLPATGPAP